MPSLAASRSYPLPVKAARDRVQRDSSPMTQGFDHRQDVAGKLVSYSGLNLAPQPARFSDVPRVAEHSTIGLPCGQCRLSPLRDQTPLLFRKSRVEVEHERIGIATEFGHDEWHSLRHQAGN